MSVVIAPLLSFEVPSGLLLRSADFFLRRRNRAGFFLKRRFTWVAECLDLVCWSDDGDGCRSVQVRR